MRLTATAFVCYLTLSAAALEADIDRVELHRTGATITRSVEVDLDPTATVIEIDNLPTGVAEQLRVTADGKTLIRDVEVDIVRNNRAFSDAVTAKRDEIAQVEASINQINDDSRIARMKLTFLKDTAAPANASEIRPVETWAAALDAIENEGAQLYAQIRDNDASIVREEANLAKLKAELDALSGANASSATLRMTAASDRARRVRIELSYFDPRAAWSSQYTASLDSSASTLELEQRAAIRQWTGESWIEVELMLGRNNPVRQTMPPPVATQFVGIARPVARFAPQMEEITVSARSLRAADASAAEKAADAFDTEFVSRYALAGRHTVHANRDKPREVTIETMRFPVDVLVRAVPRQTDTAYLMARLTPTKDLPSGTVSLFIDGRYTGRAHADQLRAGETTEIPMGADDRVSVRVTELAFEGDEVGFIGKRRVEGQAWMFDVTNHHDVTIPVEIFGRIPTSEHDDIEVTTPRDATRPDRTDIDDRPGVVVWNRDLDAGASTTIRHIYKVEYPADQRVRYRDG